MFLNQVRYLSFIKFIRSFVACYVINVAIKESLSISFLIPFSDSIIFILLMAESEEELKVLLMKVKEEREKAGLKLNIQKTQIMTFGPITSWQTDGETMKTVTDFILGGSKTTADGDCCHLIKRRLLLGRKGMTSLLLLLSLQSCPTLCDPIDGSPPGSPVPGILQARTLEWVAISLSNA